MPAPVRELVDSADGTRIEVWRSGDGPPLVLVHGTTADHTRWAAVLPELERRFTVLAMDRRDRVAGAVRPYAVEREVEDVLAVLKAAGGGVRLLGHSYGAMLALLAASRTDALDRLVLYEGGFTSSGRPEWAPVLEQVDALVRAGRREEALELFMRRVVLVRDTDLPAIRASPAWTARLRALHTIPRELHVAMTYSFRPKEAARVRAPTLLLVGGESPASEHEDARRVAAAMRDARVAVLAGQGHAAMDTGPAVFLEAVLPFLA